MVDHSFSSEGADSSHRYPDNGPASGSPAARGNRVLVGVIGLVAVIYCVLVAIHSPVLFAAGEPSPAGQAGGHPPYWMVAPFVLLLAAIAVLPLAPHASHWWESNLHKLYIALGLGIL